LYVGHSVEDAKKLAAETFEINKSLESKNVVSTRTMMKFL
jgi:hypothetical protein